MNSSTSWDTESPQGGFYADANAGQISSDLCKALRALEALKQSEDAKPFESNRPIAESLIWVCAGVALWIGLSWLL